MSNQTLPSSSTDSYKYYAYQPSLPAAAVFTSLFALATALHAIQMFRARTRFMIPFVIGALFEASGYACRIVSATESPGPYALAPYLVQSIVILIAPTLFAASIYMELGRIVLMVKGEEALFIRRTWLTKIFVTGDIFAFGIQSAGASLLSSDTPSTVNTGNTIIIVGLVTQVLSFALFVVAASLFHIRMARRPTALSQEKPWSKHMISLYIVSGLIFLRSVVRLVEYIQGHDGYLISHEVFIYVFDALLMLLAIVTMNAVHPGEVRRHIVGMKSDEHEYERTRSTDSTHAMTDMV